MQHQNLNPTEQQAPACEEPFTESDTGSNSSLQQPFHEIHSTVDLLRDQVDALQIASTEQRKPWYRKPVELSGALAIVVSIVFSSLSLWYSQNQQSYEDVKAKQELLRQTIVELIKTQQELAQVTQEQSANPLMLREANSNLNIKRTILIETADRLIQDLDEHGNYVGPTAINALVFQLQLDQRYDEAHKLAERGLEVAATADNPTAQSIALRALGQLAMVPGASTHNVEEGRKHLQQAVNLYEGKNDDNSRFALADGYLFWGILESASGFKEEANLLYEKARRTARDMNAMNPARQMMLMQIEQAQKSQTATTEFMDPRGVWQIAFDADTAREGEATIIYNAQFQNYSVRILIFDENKLTENRTGSATMTDPKTMLISWEGSRYQNSDVYSMPLPFSGVTSLTASPTGEQWKGTDIAIGEERKAVTFVKTSQ